MSPKREMASSKLVIFCSFLLTLVLLLAFQGAARELLDVASKFATLMIFNLIISFILKKYYAYLNAQQKENIVMWMRIPIHIIIFHKSCIFLQINLNFRIGFNIWWNIISTKVQNIIYHLIYYNIISPPPNRALSI